MVLGRLCSPFITNMRQHTGGRTQLAAARPAGRLCLRCMSPFLLAIFPPPLGRGGEGRVTAAPPRRRSRTWHHARRPVAPAACQADGARHPARRRRKPTPPHLAGWWRTRLTRRRTTASCRCCCNVWRCACLEAASPIGRARAEAECWWAP